MKRLKDLRKEKGYTQKKIQMLTGIDRGNYSKIENEKKQMTAEQCIRLSLALDASTDYLLGLTDEKQPHERCAP